MCGIDADTTHINLHQWIGNLILPQFDPRMSSLALLEPEIPYPLDVTGKNNVDFLLALSVAVVAFLYVWMWWK